LSTFVEKSGIFKVHSLGESSREKLCLQRFDVIWLGGRKSIRSVKTEWWGAGMVICLEQGADLHMAQLMPLTLLLQ